MTKKKRHSQQRHTIARHGQTTTLSFDAYNACLLMRGADISPADPRLARQRGRESPAHTQHTALAKMVTADDGVSPGQAAATEEEERVCTGVCCSTSFLNALKLRRKTLIDACRRDAKQRAEAGAVFSEMYWVLALCFVAQTLLTSCVTLPPSDAPPVSFRCLSRRIITRDGGATWCREALAQAVRCSGLARRGAGDAGTGSPVLVGRGESFRQGCRSARSHEHGARRLESGPER